MKRHWRIIKLETSRRRLKKHFNNPKETPLKKAYAIALGVFIGVLPIWGFQIISALFSAQFLKLNKPLAVIGSYINLTPLFPLIVFLSLKFGMMLMGNTEVSLILSEMTIKTATAYFGIYLLGSIPIALLFASIFGFITYSTIYGIRFINKFLQPVPQQIQPSKIAA
ncbi:MAG: DUF2062 domain-containing protein [Salinivirgaceae bacterium]|nr:DUF2062 domain-containing protein [Salinivirgaceae bacterium]